MSTSRTAEPKKDRTLLLVDYASTKSVYHDNGGRALQVDGDFYLHLFEIITDKRIAAHGDPRSGAAITIAINGSQSVPATPRRTNNRTVPATERRPAHKRTPAPNFNSQSSQQQPILTPSEVEAALLLVETGPFYVVTRGREPGIYTDW